MITQKDLFARVQALGLTIRKTEGGDYRIAYPFPPGGPLPMRHALKIKERIEAMAAYTDDRDDAYGTAIHMSKPAAVAAAHKALLVGVA